MAATPDPGSAAAIFGAENASSVAAGRGPVTAASGSTPAGAPTPADASGGSTLTSTPGGYAGVGGVDTTNLGTWKPGDIYSGTSTPGSTSDKSFIAQVPDDQPKPTDWNVNADQTVQGQMTKLTTNMQSNPVYQSLADQLVRANAAQGGTNSLMAETAAYSKVMDLAFNIAQDDASTYARSAEFNASMSNQFGLAQQQFMYQARLSDQNYHQSQVLQSEQINGNMQSVSMQIAGQLNASDIAAKAQVSAAGLYAGATLGAARINATTSLQEAGIQRQTTLDSLKMNFNSSWLLSEQQQGHQMQDFGMTDWENAQNSARQTSQQLTLQHGAEYNSLLNLNTQGFYQISSTPGLEASQQANAITQGVSVMKSNFDLLNSYYGSASHGLADGSMVPSSGGTLPAGMSGGGGTPGAPNTSGGGGPADPYSTYGNYLAFPGYEITAPPSLNIQGDPTGYDVGTQGKPESASAGSQGTSANFLNPDFLP